MDRLRQTLSQINGQLAGLSLSQRVAIGLCAALIAGSLLWLMQWSTTPDMAPIVAHDFSFSELDAAEAALKSNGVDYDIQGTRIYVRSEDRHNALRLMHSAGALPEGSLFDMAAAVSKQNPFQSPEAREYAENYAKGNELAKIIATWPVVKSAHVLINPRTRRRLGGQSDMPTASVSVHLSANVEMGPEMVESFARLVAGAVGGLKPQHVTVTDARTLRSYNIPSPDDAMSFDYLGMLKQREGHLRSKILGKLADIPGVQVQVSIELETSKRVTQNVRHDDPQPRMETSESSDSSTGGGAAEPGVQANLGQAITAAGAGQSSTTENTTVENFEPKVSQTETIEHLPFATRSVAAAVGIPRSFIAGIFRAKHTDKGEPKDDDPDFVALRDEQVARVRESVERIIMARSPKDVVVDVYPDLEWSAEGGWSRLPGATEAAHAGTDALTAVNLVQSYGPQAGLSLLALTSLMMMWRIARRAAPPELRRKESAGRMGIDPKPGEEPLLSVGPHSVGKAEASDSLLTGREIDESTLRWQELGREVTRMVEEDPESAAELVKRWVDEP